MIAKLGNTFTKNEKRQIQVAVSQNRDGPAKNCLKFLWTETDHFCRYTLQLTTLGHVAEIDSCLLS